MVSGEACNRSMWRLLCWRWRCAWDLFGNQDTCLQPVNRCCLYFAIEVDQDIVPKVIVFARACSPETHLSPPSPLFVLCPLCRSRLVDYTVNCRVTPHTTSTCPNQDNHQACLASYARLIGQWSENSEKSDETSEVERNAHLPPSVTTFFSNIRDMLWRSANCSQCGRILPYLQFYLEQRKERNLLCSPPIWTHRTQVQYYIIAMMLVLMED